MIGEGFFKSIFSTLQDIKQEANISHKPIPHIYDFYKITPYFQKSSGSTEGTLYKIYNSLVEGLNKENYLPHTVLLIPDRDLILQADFFQPGIGYVMGVQLDWLLKNIHRAIKMRKEDLKSFYKGTIKEQEPRIIFLKMLQRPYRRNHPFPSYNMVIDLRIKFNRTLEQTTKKYPNMSTLDLNEALSSQMFDNFGNLTHLGKIAFWRTLDTMIKNLDLEPGPVDTNTCAHCSTATPFRSASWNGPYAPNLHHTNNRNSHSDDIWGEAGRRSLSGKF